MMTTRSSEGLFLSFLRNEEKYGHGMYINEFECKQLLSFFWLIQSCFLEWLHKQLAMR